MTSGSTQQVNYYEVLGANPMDQLDRIEDLFRQLAYDAEQSGDHSKVCLLYTSPSPRDRTRSRMPSSA